MYCVFAEWYEEAHIECSNHHHFFQNIIRFHRNNKDNTILCGFFVLAQNLLRVRASTHSTRSQEKRRKNLKFTKSKSEERKKNIST